MVTNDEDFDSWFYQVENYHLLAERFWDDIDGAHLLSVEDRQRRMTDWLKAAFEAGHDAAIEELKNKTVSEHSDKYSDIVSNGGLDPRNSTEIRKQIGYIEREEGYYALYAPAKGSVVTQAFILCKYCGSAIHHTSGPKSDAVCFKCFEEAPWMNGDDDE